MNLDAAVLGDWLDFLRTQGGALPAAHAWALVLAGPLAATAGEGFEEGLLFAAFAFADLQDRDRRALEWRASVEDPGRTLLVVTFEGPCEAAEIRFDLAKGIAAETDVVLWGRILVELEAMVDKASLRPALLKVLCDRSPLN